MNQRQAENEEECRVRGDNDEWGPARGVKGLIIGPMDAYGRLDGCEAIYLTAERTEERSDRLTDRQTDRQTDERSAEPLVVVTMRGRLKIQIMSQWS